MLKYISKKLWIGHKARVVTTDLIHVVQFTQHTPPSKNYENNVYIWEIYRGKNTNADALGPVFIDKASEYGDGIS